MSLIGHQARFDALSRAVARGKTPQTLLLSGPPGVGKSTFVLAYARLLMCPNVQTDAGGLPRACQTCKTCHQIEIESFPDFRVFRPVISATEPESIPAPQALNSSVLSIEKARQFIEESSRRSLVGPRKVLFVPQFDRANENAQNAMLKTLEEPSPSVKIVLTTENHKKLRETILSRCWHLPLVPASDEEIFNWLRDQFPDALPSEFQSAVLAAHGRPGIAWREMEKLRGAQGLQKTRLASAQEILNRLERARPVAAFGLTEAALALAKEWWEDDCEGADAKKLGAKGARAAAARFLDELMSAARQRWLQDLDQPSANGAQTLDLIRQTRSQILRNANINLALDVLFLRLIELHRRPHSRT